MIWVIIGSIALLAVWLGSNAIMVKERNNSKVPENVARWGGLADKYSKEFGVPQPVIQSIIWQESSGIMDVNHNSSATGLMGVKPIAVRDVYINLPSVSKGELDGFEVDPKKNIRAGTAYLKLLHNRLRDWDKVIEAYKEGQQGRKEHSKRAQRYLTQVKNKQKFFA